MTGQRTHDVVEQPPDTHEMVVIHRAFRRESRLLAALIAAVPGGDTDRARVLARHFRWYRQGLSNHHHGEDELIWPLLHTRVDVGGDTVARMEAQHERVASTLDRATAAVTPWEATADASARDQLVAHLGDHRGVLLEHLDDEEAHLLPLARRHLSRREWGALGEHFLATTPKSQLLIFLGAVLEDADASERASVLGAMPSAARLVWYSVGRVVYARHRRRVRGR